MYILFIQVEMHNLYLQNKLKEMLQHQFHNWFK